MNDAWQAALIELLDELPRHTGLGGEVARAFVIVDFRGHPDLLARLLNAGGVSMGSVWTHTELHVYDDVAPMLIELDAASQAALRGAGHGESSTALAAVLRALHGRDDGRFAATYFLSAVSLQGLVEHFGYFCDYALPDGREFYVHWYDSRILVRALQVWDEGQRADFLAPVITLAYALREGGYIRLQGGAQGAIDLHGETLLLAPQQHQLFFDLDYPDKLAVQLRNLYIGMLPGDPVQDELVPKVQEQLDRARKHGITGDKDTFDYVAWGIAISPRFDEHPLIRNGLADYRPNAVGGLSGALAHVPDAVWDDLQRAEWARTNA